MQIHQSGWGSSWAGGLAAGAEGWSSCHYIHRQPISGRFGQTQRLYQVAFVYNTIYTYTPGHTLLVEALKQLVQAECDASQLDLASCL